MVLSDEIRDSLDRLVSEQRNLQQIGAHGLAPRSRILLAGPPGTGKTMSASAIAGELGLPLYRIRMETLFTKYLGETAAKLRMVFEHVEQVRGVYLFDEFDSVANQRNVVTDVGEMTRVVNTFLQLLDSYRGESIVLAATNSHNTLDRAIFRRFDDLVTYPPPSRAAIATLLNRRFASYSTYNFDDSEILNAADGLAFGDIVRACDETLKDMILRNQQTIDPDALHKHLLRRKDFYTST